MIGLRSQLNANSKMRICALNGPISSRHKYFNQSFIKRNIHFDVEKEIPDKGYVVKLTNDFSRKFTSDSYYSEDNLEKYINESMNDFKSLVDLLLWQWCVLHSLYGGYYDNI
jgi:hypothetical protein